MNKFIVILVTGTMFMWGVFLYRMVGVVAGDNVKTEERISTPAVDFNSLLQNLSPQLKLDSNGRDPFAVPQVYVKPIVKKAVTSNRVQDVKPTKVILPPAISLDAILPGENPVAILKKSGESAVVSVGQEIWGVVIKVINAQKVVFTYEATEFTLNYP